METGKQLQWFVLYTKSRNEKLVAEKLNHAGIEAYCPIKKVKNRWSDRIKVVEEPLFRSYVFVRLSEKERARVFGIPGVVRYLFWLGKAAVVREEEIKAIRELLTEYEHEYISTSTILPNDLVRINTGHLAETDARVLNIQGKKMYVRLEALQMNIVVDLQHTEVRKVI